MPVRLAGVLCAGNLVADVLVRPADEIRWNGTVWVDSIRQAPGGNGANTSYTLARLGVPVRLLGGVGRDELGNFLLGRLSAAGVDTALIMRTAAETAATVGLVRASGDRAFLHRPGASAEVFTEPVGFGPEITAGMSAFHLANPFGLPRIRTHAAETLRRARAAGLRTSLDTGWDARGEWMAVLAPCLTHLDVLFTNEEEARMLTGEAWPEGAAAAFREQGCGTVVVKLGAHGCAVFNEDGEQRFPAFVVNAVDTTGAGDCFAGGFLAALQRGYAVAEAARFANAAGALSVRELGSVEGLLDWEEMVRWMSAATHDCEPGKLNP